MTDIVERLRRRRLPIDVGQFTIYEDDKECHEAADEIERLREALRRVRTAIFDAKPEVLTDTLWMHDRLGETVVDCIDDALNDYDWEVRDRAALGEKE